jgi:hypothetical protein
MIDPLMQAVSHLAHLPQNPMYYPPGKYIFVCSGNSCENPQAIKDLKGRIFR